MSYQLRPVDDKETYIVRAVFACAEGHCPGVRFTHWEEGEACLYVHEHKTANADCHYYWRLALVPLKRGSKGNPYDPDSEDWWDWANGDENVNKSYTFSMAPSHYKEGDRIEPGTFRP